MPTFDGYLITPLDSDPVGGYINSEMLIAKSRITTDKPKTGLSSLVLGSGGVHDVYYGCAAGSTTIAVWCWPPAGTGACALEVLEVNGGDVLARDVSVGTEDWEQLSITFTAQKKVYRVRMVNRVKAGGDTRAYFDDLT
jgi:hypothetical protein